MPDRDPPQHLAARPSKGWLFTMETEEGEPLNYRRWKTEWNGARKALQQAENEAAGREGRTPVELPHMVTHDLRHFVASALITGGAREIHTDSGGIHGSPRVHAVLKREGVHVGRKRVERLMREADIAGISPRRKGFTRRDPRATLAPDLVQRDFTASAPNRLWVTDLTMITTGEGPLWLSAIRDAFSRRVVAWETSARADADLVLSTLEYALASREIEPGQLVNERT